jgi:hypothetical protein
MVPSEYRALLTNRDEALPPAVLEGIMQNSTAAFALRRGMLVHGVHSPLAYLRAMLPYTLVDCAGRIACPTLVTQAENDVRASQSQELYDALACPKTLLRFSDTEGAGEHCEAGAAALFDQRVFDWLDETLAPR